jgi:hypothetical protein
VVEPNEWLDGAERSLRAITLTRRLGVTQLRRRELVGRTSRQGVEIAAQQDRLVRRNPADPFVAEQFAHLQHAFARAQP